MKRYYRIRPDWFMPHAFFQVEEWCWWWPFWTVKISLASLAEAKKAVRYYEGKYDEDYN